MADFRGFYLLLTWEGFMSSILGHSLAGIAVASAVAMNQPETKKNRLLITAAVLAVVPDLDVLIYIAFGSLRNNATSRLDAHAFLCSHYMYNTCVGVPSSIPSWLSDGRYRFSSGSCFRISFSTISWGVARWFHFCGLYRITVICFLTRLSQLRITVESAPEGCSPCFCTLQQLLACNLRGANISSACFDIDPQVNDSTVEPDHHVNYRPSLLNALYNRLP